MKAQRIQVEMYIIVEFVLIWIFLVPLFSLAANDIFTLGGLFSLSDTNGFTDEGQFDSMMGFLLAINEINSRSDILPRMSLKYVIRGGHGFNGAISAAQSILSVGAQAAVGSLPNVETIAADQYFAHYEIVQAHAMASDTELGNGLLVPFKVQTCPIDSFQGMVLQHILCLTFNITRIVIFSSDDNFGTKAATETADGTYCTMQVLESFLIPPFVEDFSKFILKASHEKASVFVLHLPPRKAAILLEQGYKLGLFGEHSQIFSSLPATSVDTLKYLSDGADVAAIMKGFIGIEFWPEYYAWTPRGKSFLTKWRNQTTITPTACRAIVDASGYSYLYNNVTQACITRNFASYSPNGSNISAYAAYTYDATYVIANALDILINTGVPVSGKTLRRAIVNNVTFDGVTGPIMIYKGGIPGSEFYAAGGREVGHHYKILNFNAEAYNENINNSFVQVAHWSMENGTQACKPDMGCEAIIFSTSDNLIPSDVPPYALAKEPSIVKIGGLFNIIDSIGGVDIAQVENLAAFLMAINEINNKADGRWDQLLPNTQLKFALASGHGFTGGVNAMEVLEQSFFHTGVRAIVGALPNIETEAAEEMAIGSQTIHIHSVATDTLLGDASMFPFKSQVVPLDSFQGMVLQHIFCTYFQSRKVVTFATTDMFGSKAAMESTDGTYCNLTVLASYSLRSDTYHFHDIITSASALGSNYFFLFMPPANAVALLVQGHAQGLFKEGTQIIVPTLLTGPDLMKHFPQGVNVAAIMKGVVGVQWWPTYCYRTRAGRDFVTRWRRQTPTVLPRGLCVQTKDDAGQSFLYRDGHNASHCAGLMFDRYSPDGRDVTPNVAYTYDATYVLAIGLDALIRSGAPITGPALRQSIYENALFDGVTGPIDIFEGAAALEYYGAGGREVGHHYKIVNFNAKAYAKNINNSFVQVAYWSAENGTQACEPDMGCEGIIFNTRDNLPPPDTPPDIYIRMQQSLRAALFAITAIALAVVIPCIVIAVVFRQEKLIKASQPVMLYFIFSGELLAVGRVFVAAWPLTVATCNLKLWFGHMSFVLVFGALFIKSWRVNKLINNRTLKRVKITSNQVAIMMAVVTVLACGIMGLMTGLGHPFVRRMVSTVSNQSTIHEICALDHRFVHIQTVVFVLEALAMLLGVRLCWAVKDVPDVVNESKPIAGAMVVIAMLSAMVFPIVFVLDLDPISIDMLAAISFAMASIFSSTILFGFKAWDLYKEYLERKSSAAGPPINAKRNAPVHPSTEPQAVVASTVALKGLSMDDKARFCIQQRDQWEKLLLQINERSTGSGSGGSRMSSVASGDLTNSRSNHYSVGADDDALASRISEPSNVINDDVEGRDGDGMAWMLTRAEGVHGVNEKFQRAEDDIVAFDPAEV